MFRILVLVAVLHLFIPIIEFRIYYGSILCPRLGHFNLLYLIWTALMNILILFIGGAWSISLQVKAGSVYDNILICDDPEYAKQVVEEIFAHREVSNCLRVLSSLNSKKKCSTSMFIMHEISDWKRSLRGSREREKG